MLLIFTSKQKYCFNYCMLIISAYIYLGVFEKTVSPSGVLRVGVLGRKHHREHSDWENTSRYRSVSKMEKKRFSCRAVLINRERSIHRNPSRGENSVGSDPDTPRRTESPSAAADSHADPRFTSAAVQTVLRK